MTAQLNEIQAGAPPGAGIRNENGIFRLQVRELVAPWVKRVLIILPLIGVANLIVIAFVTSTHRATESGLKIAILLAAVALAAAMLGALVIGFICLIATVLTGDIIFDGQLLRVRDRGSNYDLPVKDIRGIRQVSYGRSRLEVTTSGPPGRFFFRGLRTAMEVETTEGRIEFFNIWDERKVAWLTQNTRRLVLNEKSAPAGATIDAMHSPDAVIATKVYGQFKRSLTRGLIALGIITGSAAGWYTWLGWCSTTWPQVEGHVLRSEYREGRDTHDSDTEYVANIEYAYKVDSRDFANDDLGYGRSPGDDIVKAVVTSHPKGSPVTVYYDPDKPSRSVVIRGVGGIQWLVCFMCAVPLLGAVPLVRRRTTPAQDLLAARYKVASGPVIENAQRTGATMRWTVPEDSWAQTLRSARWAALWMCVRICGLTAVSIWAIYYWLAPHVDPSFPWKRVGLIMMGFVAFYGVAQWLSLVLSARSKPPEYSLTDAGILTPSRERPLIRWERIASFTIDSDPHLADHHTLVLHLKSGVSRMLGLPIGDEQASIVQQLSAKLRNSAPANDAQGLTAKDWTIGFGVTTVTGWFLGVYLSHGHRALNGSGIITSIMLLGIAAGPGTWLARILWRRRSHERLIAYAVLLNFYWTIGSLTLATILRAIQD